MRVRVDLRPWTRGHGAHAHAHCALNAPTRRGQEQVPAPYTLNPQPSTLNAKPTGGGEEGITGGGRVAMSNGSLRRTLKTRARRRRGSRRRCERVVCRHRHRGPCLLVRFNVEPGRAVGRQHHQPRQVGRRRQRQEPHVCMHACRRVAQPWRGRILGAQVLAQRRQDVSTAAAPKGGWRHTPGSTSTGDAWP